MPLQITQPEKPKDSEKQSEAGGYKIDEKKLAEIPIKARGLLDMDEEVVYAHLFALNVSLCFTYRVGQKTDCFFKVCNSRIC